MIRMYEYEPRVDEQGNATEGYRDFQNYLFSHPYGFLWDFLSDKVVIYGIAYRISSLRRIPDSNQVICLCCGDGSGSGGSSFISKVKTDESLHGEGSETDPLGVQLSQKDGNRLQILEDGCYVGAEPLPYSPPSIILSSSIPQGEYLFGEMLENMILTVKIIAGTEPVRDVRIFEGTDNLHVFEAEEGSQTYTFELPASVTGDIAFTASVSDGNDYLSNKLTYKFVLPLFCGVSDAMTLTETEILAVTPVKVSGSSFVNIYGAISSQHIWMCCPESRVIKNIKDENGFDVTAAFKKTAVRLTLSEDEKNYSLYVFDTKITGSNYKVTFSF